MVSYPSSLLISTSERLCVELFRIKQRQNLPLRSLTQGKEDSRTCLTRPLLSPMKRLLMLALEMGALKYLCQKLSKEIPPYSRSPLIFRAQRWSPNTKV